MVRVALSTSPALWFIIWIEIVDARVTPSRMGLMVVMGYGLVTANWYWV